MTPIKPKFLPRVDQTPHGPRDPSHPRPEVPAPGTPTSSERCLVAGLVVAPVRCHLTLQSLDALQLEGLGAVGPSGEHRAEVRARGVHWYTVSKS